MRCKSGQVELSRAADGTEFVWLRCLAEQTEPHVWLLALDSWLLPLGFYLHRHLHPESPAAFAASFPYVVIMRYCFSPLFFSALILLLHNLAFSFRLWRKQWQQQQQQTGLPLPPLSCNVHLNAISVQCVNVDENTACRLFISEALLSQSQNKLQHKSVSSLFLGITLAYFTNYRYLINLILDAESFLYQIKLKNQNISMGEKC